MTYCSGLFPDGPERINLQVQKRLGSGTPAVTSVKQCPCDKLPKSLTETAVSYIAERSSVLQYLFPESLKSTECTLKTIEKRKRTYEFLKLYIC